MGKSKIEYICPMFTVLIQAKKGIIYVSVLKLNKGFEFKNSFFDIHWSNRTHISQGRLVLGTNGGKNVHSYRVDEYHGRYDYKELRDEFEKMLSKLRQEYGWIRDDN